MHRAADQIFQEGHAAKDRANALQAVGMRLVEEGRHLGDVAGHQQEALPALRQAADLAAVVRRLVHRVAVVA